MASALPPPNASAASDKRAARTRTRIRCMGTPPFNAIIMAPGGGSEQPEMSDLGQAAGPFGHLFRQLRGLPEALSLDTIASSKGRARVGVRQEPSPARGHNRKGRRRWAKRRASQPAAPAASHWLAP